MTPNQLATKLSDQLMERAESNWTNFMDIGGGRVEIDRDAAFEAVFLDLIPAEYQDSIHDALYNHPFVCKALDAMEELAQEAAADQREWGKGHKVYYGVYDRDFI